MNTKHFLPIVLLSLVGLQANAMLYPKQWLKNVGTKANGIYTAGKSSIANATTKTTGWFTRGKKRAIAPTEQFIDFSLLDGASLAFLTQINIALDSDMELFNHKGIHFKEKDSILLPFIALFETMDSNLKDALNDFIHCIGVYADAKKNDHTKQAINAAYVKAISIIAALESDTREQLPIDVEVSPIASSRLGSLKNKIAASLPSKKTAAKISAAVTIPAVAIAIAEKRSGIVSNALQSLKAVDYKTLLPRAKEVAKAHYAVAAPVVTKAITNSIDWSRKNKGTIGKAAAVATTVGVGSYGVYKLISSLRTAKKAIPADSSK